MMCQQLVRLDTTSGRPLTEVFDLVGPTLERHGYSVTVGGTDSAFLLARPPRPDRELLLFACHVDTVPVGDPAHWRFPPHSATIADGRLYGRGASDMKSGLAATVAALAQTDSAGLLITSDEEVGCLGAFAAQEQIADLPVGAVIIPESTENKIALGHRGALWLEVSAQGVAAHGGTPERGRNALLLLAEALLDMTRRAPMDDRHADLGGTTMNVGTMVAGTAVNIVPEAATATLDVRYVDPDQPTQLLHWMAAEHPGLVTRVMLDLPPVWTPRDDEWVRSLPAGSASPGATTYFTDAAALTAAMPHQTPIVIWGPGDPRQAHVLDESVDLAKIVEATALYTTAIRDWSRRV